MSGDVKVSDKHIITKSELLELCEERIKEVSYEGASYTMDEARTIGVCRDIHDEIARRDDVADIAELLTSVLAAVAVMNGWTPMMPPKHSQFYRDPAENEVDGL